MNGAIAEPLVSTIRPPKITIMIRIGSSQNFLRSLMKAQSSTMMEAMKSVPLRSELVTHRLRRRPGRRALDPVALGLPVQPQAQEILAEQAHHNADRRNGHEEQQAEDQWIHDLVEQQAKLQPQLVERRQQAGEDKRHREEHGGERQGPVPASVVTPP